MIKNIILFALGFCLWPTSVHGQSAL